MFRAGQGEQVQSVQRLRWQRGRREVDGSTRAGGTLSDPKSAGSCEEVSSMSQDMCKGQSLLEVVDERTDETQYQSWWAHNALGLHRSRVTGPRGRGGVTAGTLLSGPHKPTATPALLQATASRGSLETAQPTRFSWEQAWFQALPTVADGDLPQRDPPHVSLPCGAQAGRVPSPGRPLLGWVCRGLPPTVEPPRVLGIGLGAEGQRRACTGAS